MNKHTATLLEQHFDTAFNAPNGIQKLRELILTLAMQGKLVEQDPSDPPASALLKEIEAEKKRLVQAGKIKAPKPLPPVAEEEKPYELPLGWEWVRNASLFDLRKGKVPKELSETEGKIPYLDIEALDRGNIRRYTNDEKTPQAKKTDILVVCDGSRSGLILDGKEGAIGSTLSVIDAPSFIQPFVKLLFCHGYEHMNSTMKGAAIPHLDTKSLLLTVTGLPPLNEQKRIIEKVDHLMCRCDSLEKLRTAQNEKRLTVHAAAIGQLLNIAEPAEHQRALAFLADHFGDLYTVKANVAELRKAILQLAVMGKLVPQHPNDPPASALLKDIEAEKKRLVKEGKIKAPKPLPPVADEEKPYALPQGWEWVRLGLLVTVQTGKKDVNEGHESGLYPFFSCAAAPLKSNNFSFDCEALLLPGNGANVGQITRYKGKFEAYQRTYILSDFPFDIAGYLEKVLNARFLKSIEGKQYGSAINYIKIGNLTDFLVPLPSLPEQHRIVAKIDELMALCNSLDQQIDAATTKQNELLDAVMAQM